VEEVPITCGFLCLSIFKFQRRRRREGGAATRRFKWRNMPARLRFGHEKKLCTGRFSWRVEGSHEAQNARIDAIRFADSPFG
jgi:hypothetical protein